MWDREEHQGEVGQLGEEPCLLIGACFNHSRDSAWSRPQRVVSISFAKSKKINLTLAVS